MKNQEVFCQAISDYLAKLPAKVPTGQKVYALAGIVRTNEMVYFLGPTQFFNGELDIDCQTLAANIAKEVFAYASDGDPVYFGQSLLVLPHKMAHKNCAKLTELIDYDLAQRLARSNIIYGLDLLLISKPDLKGCWMDRLTRGTVRMDFGRTGYSMGCMKNPQVNVTPNPAGNGQPAIDVLLQYVATAA